MRIADLSSDLSGVALAKEEALAEEDCGLTGNGFEREIRCVAPPVALTM